MRYYDLTLKDPSSGKTYSWTSGSGADYDAGALNIYFDAFVVGIYPSAGASIVGIEGINLKYLEQPLQFQGFDLSLKAGMVGGLPISAAQPIPGTILKGLVYGSYGNWIAERLAIEFVVTATNFEPDNPGNFTFVWPKGTQLSDALQQTLQTAFPGAPIKMNIGNYVWPHTEVAKWGTTFGLGRFIYQLTSAINKGGYAVRIYLRNGTIFVTDFSNAKNQNAIQLQYYDLIGQPTWIEAGVLSVPVVLRADIQVGDIVSMPAQDTGQPGFASVLASVDNALYNLPLTFKGKFIVRAVRQIGQFRGQSGEDWMSVLECVALTPVVSDSSG